MASIPRPFEGSYPISLTTALLALVPYIFVTTAYVFYRDEVVQAIGGSRTGVEIISGLATAAYAFGALLGGDLTQRFPQRRLFLLFEAVLVLGCAFAAAADGIVLYGAGRVLFGFATGVLLVAALPPVIQRFPTDRLPITVIFVNIGFFGAVTVGPLLGGVVAAEQAWRLFYAVLAAVGAVTFGLALLTLPSQKPPNPGLPLDVSGLALGFAATVLPFWGVSELTGHSFRSLFFAVPVAVGLACFVALLLVEYHKEEPLAPVKRMWTTFPVVGSLVAMVGGGALVAFVMLATQFMLVVERRPPLSTGLMFWPQVVGVLISAALLGVIVRTRFLPILILVGMLVLLGGGALLLAVEPKESAGVMLAATGLLGLGAGATVSPGLYLAGFSLPSQVIGRIFALIELVRSVADFILAPVMLRVARLISGGQTLAAGGIRPAVWITLAIAGAFTILGVVIYLLGRGGLPLPDLEGWLKHGRTAVDSPPLLAALRRGARRD